MATITSAQSGYWNAPGTWQGGVVPDLTVDDVVIAANHTVTTDGSALTLSANRTITVFGELKLETPLTVEGNASIDVHGSSLYVHNDLLVKGWFRLYEGACAYVECSGSLIVANYAYLIVSYDALLVVSGDGRLTVRRYGVVYHVGTVHFDAGSQSDLFGPAWWMSEEADLYLGSGAVVRLYRGMSLAGRFISEGGKIVMLRRETCLSDAGGNSLFVCEQVYGHGPTLVA